MVLLSAIAEADNALGLPSIPPNPNQTLAAIGKELFFDSRLSADGFISCASCHRPEIAFTDARPVAQGVKGQTGTRNSPSLLNSRFNSSFFWEGRTPTLEEQVLQPLFSPLEHGLSDTEMLVGKVKADRSYVRSFSKAYPRSRDPVNKSSIAAALAAYVGSLNSAESAFDRYVYGHEKGALTEAQVRGLALFQGRADCVRCHTVGEKAALFTDQKFHSLGVGLPDLVRDLPSVLGRYRKLTPDALGTAIASDAELANLGRFLVTGNPADIGQFRTPSLRNVALTAPYMHDGSVPTLSAALDREVYYRSLSNGRPLVLTPAEKDDLLEFLKALDSRVMPADQSRKPSP